jgi:hypothetical protein
MKNRFGIDWSQAKGTHFWSRPPLDRRLFFRHLGAAVGGYFMVPGRPLETVAKAAGSTMGTAKNVIFVLMAGGPSHSDTFDLKEGAWTLPAMEPTSYGSVRWPRGLFPKLADQMGSVALLRSAKSWALVHGIVQTWVQIGRNPLSGLSKVAPHIGSVVSRELGGASADKPLPAFVSLNANGGPGQGYLAPEHAPFYVTPGGNGLGLTTHPQGPQVLDRRYGLLLDLDAETRATADITASVKEMERFNLTARTLMYNGDVDKVFTFAADERTRYGGTAFGNACITARNLLRANLGTRFVQITVGGWDNHSAIYTGALNPTNANSLAHQFDNGIGTLLADLKNDGLLDQTLVVCLGEFGRTVGPLNNQNGRDHYLNQAVMMAGGGIKGGRAVGATDSTARNIVEPGWAGNREIRTEDIEATIYSALGIDWTKAYWDDPFGRGFYLVPNNQGVDYMPVHELW